MLSIDPAHGARGGGLGVSVGRISVGVYWIGVFVGGGVCVDDAQEVSRMTAMNV